MAPRLIVRYLSMSRPRYATLCAVAALAVGLGGCAGTSEPARTAVRTAEATKSPEGNTGEALARIANRSLEAGDPVSAVAMLKRAHEMSPDSAAILAELGRTLAALQAWQESAAAYAKAAEIAPNDAGIRRGRAAALLALDLPTLAEQEYRAALALREDAPTLSGLGVTLDLLGRHDDAVATYRKALELDPNGAATRTNLGLSLALWGASDEAVTLLAPMAAASTADARQRQNLALAFGLAGDLDQARAVSKIDLGEEAVRNNLAYYETLRGLTPVLRMRAMMGKYSPVVPGAAAPKIAANATTAPAAKPVDVVPPGIEPAKPSRAAEAATTTKKMTVKPAKLPSKAEVKPASVTEPTPAITAENSAPPPEAVPQSVAAEISQQAQPETTPDPSESGMEAVRASESSGAPVADVVEVPAGAPAKANAGADDAAALADAATGHLLTVSDERKQLEATVGARSGTDAVDAATESAGATAIPPQEARLPSEELPAVTVRASGVPVASVPQSQLAPEISEQRVEPGDAPPASEPVKRDPPTRLLPSEHAAAEPEL